MSPIRANSSTAAGVAFLVSLCVAGCSSHLSPHIGVPAEYKHQPSALMPPPNGEPEVVRYRKSYEAFWWNCVIVRSRDVDARCPSACSGTPAAVAGCGQGSGDADTDISALVSRKGSSWTQEYLKAFVQKSDGYEKIRAYFPDGPKAETVRDYGDAAVDRALHCRDAFHFISASNCRRSAGVIVSTRCSTKSANSTLERRAASSAAYGLVHHA